MVKHKLTRMSGRGDEQVAEWVVGETDEATSVGRLAEIEAEFDRLVKSGYFAADLATNELVDKFDAKTDLLLIPRMQGGLCSLAGCGNSGSWAGLLVKG